MGKEVFRFDDLHYPDLLRDMIYLEHYEVFGYY